MFFAFFWVAVLFFSNSSIAQPCDPSTPTFTVDLSGSPDSVWISTAVKRSGQCCGSSNPDRCIEFFLTLDSGAQGFKFDIASGAQPSGALFYQIACGPPTPVGTPLCLNDPGPHRITFCKPGSNLNQYRITSIAKPEASPPTVVSDGCSAIIFAKNYIESSLQWTSVPFDPDHVSYMDCTSGCDTVNIQIDSADSPPDSIIYQVTGIPEGGCNTDSVTLQITVYFVSDKFVEILPKDPSICFGGVNTSVTANGNGGAPPYAFEWYDSLGAFVGNTATIPVWVGWYYVVMTDSTDCPPVFDTVYVTANPSAISADAGPALSSCKNNPDIALQGSVIVATGGRWSGGGGSYNPHDSSLTAIYTPTNAELTAGSVTLTLTTIGNGICPAVTDQVTISYLDSPLVNAGGPYVSCGNNSQIILNGTVTNAGGGRWSGGSGTYSPNDSSLVATYTPTPTEIANGGFIITLTSIQNGNCIPVSDTALVTITPAPTVDPGPDHTVCANNPDVLLNASVTVAGGATWSGGGGTFSGGVNGLINNTYTPSPLEITNGVANLTLTTFGSTGCIEVDSTVTITITPAPVVFAGNDISICANNATASLNGSVTIAAGGRWSGGLGNFNPHDSSLTATYIPTAGEITNGFVDLILSSYGNGNCLVERDTVRINITPAPTIFAGPDTALCGNNPNVPLNGMITVASGATWSGGLGAYSNGVGSLTGTYTPTPAEITGGAVTLVLTTTSGLGNCLAVSDSFDVTFAPGPTVNAGNDTTVCGNSPVVSLNGSLTVATQGTWSTSGTGMFSGINDLNSTYTLSAADITAGTVTLTLTTSAGVGICNDVSDDVVVTILPGPSVAAGPDQIVCSTAPDVSLAGTFSNAAGITWSGDLGGAYNPSNTDPLAVYTPTATEITNGSAQLIITTNNIDGCPDEADTVDISIIPGPVANAGTIQPTCANNAAVNLSGSVQNAGGGVWTGAGTFLPNNQDLTGTYIPSAFEIGIGFSSLILRTDSNGICPEDRDTVDFFIIPAPQANAGNDQTVCANNPTTSFTGTIILGDPLQSTWSGGSGTYVPNPPTGLNLTYTPSATEISTGFVDLVFSTNRSGCLPVFDTVRLNVSPSPIVDAGVDQTVCANNADVTLNGSVLNSGGGRWTAINGTGSFSPHDSLLNAVYSPSDADTAQGFVTMVLTSIQNGSCVAVSDTMVITITDAPTVNPGSLITICANNAVATLNGSMTVATGGVWSGGNGLFTLNNSDLNATYVPTATEISNGGLFMTLTTTQGLGNCNAVSDSVRIDITPAPTVNAGNDQSVCADNAAVTLNGSMTIATQAQWTGGNGLFAPDNQTLNATYTPSATEISNGSVTLSLVTTMQGNCTSVSDAMTITIGPPPTVNAGNDQDVCGDLAPVALNGQVTVALGGTWSTANGGGGFSPSPDSLNAVYNPVSADTALGSITLTLTSTNNQGCNSRTDDVVINFVSAPTVDAGVGSTVCTNDFPIVLNGSGSQSIWSGGTGTFAPDTAALNASYTPSATEVANGSVTLTLTTIPNAFCPAISSSVTYPLVNGPSVNAGTDQIICGSSASANLSGAFSNTTGIVWTTLGSGTFSDSSSITSSYTFSATDRLNDSVLVVISSVPNGICSIASDTVVLYILEEIIANAGPDLTACADASGVNIVGNITGATGGVWTTLGGGSFSPDSASLAVSYVPVPGDTSGSVLIALTSTGNNGCPADVDTMFINFYPAPRSLPGPDDTVCADLALVPISGSVLHATSSVWSTSGSGSFSPLASDLNTNYVPSAADTAAGGVYLTLKTFGPGTCNSVVDSFFLNIDPAPVVNAGSNIIVCADNPVVPLNGTVWNAGGGVWSSSGTGSFLPDSFDINGTYVLSTADSAAGIVTLDLTSTNNGFCNAVTDQLLITTTPAPTVSAGPDIEVCADVASIPLSGAVTVSGGGRWSTSGFGSFTPNDSALNAAYVPDPLDTAVGSVILTITSIGNGNCQAVQDSILITFKPLPKIDAGVDTTICGDLPFITLYGSSISSPGGVIWSSNGVGGIFSNSDTLPNADYYPSTSDSLAGGVLLFLTARNTGVCPAVTDTLDLTITPGVVVNAGSDMTVCADTSAIPLNAVVTNATGGFWTTSGTGTFSPDTLDPTASYIPSSFDTAAGIVVLTYTSTGNGQCFAQSANITINFLPAPKVFAGPDQTLCSNQGVLNLSGSVTHASGGVWSTNGAGSFSPDSTQLITNYLINPADTVSGLVELYLFTTGTGICRTYVDTMTLNFQPQILVQAGNDLSVCADAPSVQLNGIVQNSTGGTWSTSGSGSFSPSVTDSNAVYIPSAGDDSLGVVTLRYTSDPFASCAASFDELVLTLTPGPTVDAGLDQSSCASSPSITLNGSFTVSTGARWSTASGFGSFSPNDSAMNAVFTPTATQIGNGTVVITLTTTGNGDCNTYTDNMVLTIQPDPVADAGPDITICADTPTLPLNGTITGATGGQWTTLPSGGLFNPDDTTLNGAYQYSLSDALNGMGMVFLTSRGNGVCPADVDTLNLFITPAPTIDAGPDTLCSDETGVGLTGVVTTATGLFWDTTGITGSFSPNPSSPTVLFTPSAAELAAGSVKLYLVSTGNGNCNQVMDSIVILTNPAPTVNAGTDKVRCADNPSVALNGQITISSSAYWESLGGGSFAPDSSSLTAVYTPSALDIANGGVDLVLITDDPSICIEETDTIHISITGAPSIVAGPAVAQCSDRDTVQLSAVPTIANGGVWSTSGSGSFIDSALLNAVYVASAADIAQDSIYLVVTSTGNGLCNAVIDSTLVIFNPAPTVDAGPDYPICDDADTIFFSRVITVASGGFWTTTGAGTYIPNDSSAVTIQYIVDSADYANGGFSMINTTTGNGDCFARSDSSNITFEAFPTASISVPNQCAVDTVNLIGAFTNSALAYWTSSGTGNFIPDTTSLNVQYIPSAADILAGAVDIYFQTTGAVACFDAIDSVNLNLSPPPEAIAGTNDTVCADTVGYQLAGVVNNATIGAWTTSGTGTFLPDTGTLAAVYVPSAADTAAGSVFLVLQTVDNGLCSPDFDTLELIITPAPFVDAGPGVVCDNNAVLAISGIIYTATGGVWTTNGDGTFADSSQLATVYTLGPNDLINATVTLLLSSTGNGSCNLAGDSMVINVTPPPSAFAGNDTTICSDQTGITLNGSVITATGGGWITLGSGSFADTTVLNTTYTFSPQDIADDSVILVLVTTGNGSCLPSEDSIIIYFSPTPVISAGDTTICQGSGGIPLTGTSSIVPTSVFWSSTGTGNYTPNNNLNTTYNPSPADITNGSVTAILRVSVAGCNDYFDSLDIQFTPPPVVNPGVVQVVCADTNFIQLNGTVSNAGGLEWSSNGTGTFNDSSLTNAQYFLSLADTAMDTITFYLTSTSNGGCVADFDSVDLLITPAPVLDAGPDQVVCADTGTININTTLFHAGNVLWSTTGSNSILPTNTSQNINYTLSASDTTMDSLYFFVETQNAGSCKTVFDTVLVEVTPAPTLVFTPNTICSVDPNIQLNAQLTVAQGVLWSTSGSGNFIPNNTDPMAIYIRSAADSTAGFVYIRGRSQNQGSCKEILDSLLVNFIPAPEATVGPDQQVCDDADTIDLSGMVVTATGGVWTTNGNGLITDTTNLTTQYVFDPQDYIDSLITFYLTTTGNGTCLPDVDSLQVAVVSPAPVADAGTDFVVCADVPSLQLSGSVTNAAGGSWSGGAGFYSPNPNDLLAIYFPDSADTVGTAPVPLFLQTFGGNAVCQSDIDTVLIVFANSPNLDAGLDQTICEDSAIATLNATVSAGNPIIWTSSGTGTFSDSSDVNAQYFASPQDITDSVVNLLVSTTGANGCQIVTDQVKIFIRPGPQADAGFPSTICADETAVPLSGSFLNAGGSVWTTSGTGTFADSSQAVTTYFPSDTDTALGLINLTLTTIANAGCNAADSTIQLNITPAVTLDAGPDQVVCSNALDVQLIATATVATSVQWSSVNNGVFSPSSNGFTPRYFFDSLDYLQDSIYLTATTPNINGCLSKSDSAKIIFVPNPTVDAGVDQVLCSDNPIATLNGVVTVAGGGRWTTSGSGTFLPNDSALNATYQMSAADILAQSVNLALTSIQNGQCDSITDFVNISIVPAPSVDAGGNQTICYSQGTVTVSGFVTDQSSVSWSSTGTGNFSAGSSVTTDYNLTTADRNAGSVTLYLQANGNGSCAPVIDSLIINVLPIISVSAGPDLTICADLDSVVLLGTVQGASSVGWISSGTGLFAPSHAVIDPTYFPSLADDILGTVGLTVTTDSLLCPPLSDGMVLTITPAPTITLGPDQLVCNSEDSVLLTSTVTVASGILWTSSGTGTFLPSDSAFNPVYQPTAADVAASNILITATTTGNGTCNPVSDVTLVSFKPDPSVDAGFDQTVCAATSGVSLSGIVNDAGGGLWTSNGGGVFVPSPTSLNAVYVPNASDTVAGSIEIYLESQFEDGCVKDFDTMVVNFDPLHVVTTGQFDACADATGILLSGTVFNSNGGTWTTNGGGIFSPGGSDLTVTYVPSASDFTNGSVILTLTSNPFGACPQETDDATIIITDLPIANAGEEQTICRGAQATLVPIIESGNNYDWFTLDSINIGNSGIIDVVASSDTMFVLRVTDINGCISYDTADVFVVDPPDFTLQDHFCFEEGLVINSNPSFDPLLGTYQWIRNDSVLVNENNDSLLVESHGDHIVVYNFESCSVSDTTTVTLPPILNGETTYACDGDTVTVRIDSHPGANYQWFRDGVDQGVNSSTILATASDSAVYSVVVTDTLTCVSSDTILLVPVPPPVLALEDINACIGDRVMLDGRPVNLIDSLESTYQWFQNGEILPGETSPDLTVTDSGSYAMEYALGSCMSRDSSYVAFRDLPIPDNDPKEIFCKELAATIPLDAGPATRYFWFYTGDTTRISEHDDFGYFYFEVYNEWDCKEVDSILVEENCPPTIFFPNAFSPNGDNIDDFYKIFGNNFANMEFKIYNRWGEVIFRATTKEEVWDGTYLGEEMPAGVYPWTATWEGVFAGQEGPFTANGSVTLIR